MSVVKSTNLMNELLDLLMRSPTPQQLLDFRASESVQQRVQYLLEANRNGTLSADERNEMDELSRTDHFVTLIKARAMKSLNLA